MWLKNNVTIGSNITIVYFYVMIMIYDAFANKMFIIFQFQNGIMRYNNNNNNNYTFVINQSITIVLLFTTIIKATTSRRQQQYQQQQQTD